MKTALLELSCWIARQGRFRRVYRYVPARLRSAVLRVIEAPARNHAAFRKTAAWSRSIPATTPIAAPNASAFPAAAGVNIHGYFRGQFGLGEGVRLYAQALIDSGYPVALRDIELQVPHGLDDHSMDEQLGSGSPHDIHLVLVNPDYFDEAKTKIGKARLESGYVIACWFWELERVPDEWQSAMGGVDEIMVSSSFVEQAFRSFTDKPVFRVPLPVGKMPDSGLSRKDFGLRSDAFLFLCSFDFNSGIARKNPLAVIEAFRTAFPRERNDVQLLVKSINGHRYPEAFLELMQAAGSDPRIVLRDEVIARPHMHALQRCMDAYVSLHRAEGFGLGLAEGMWLGKPVVATNWSGNTDFMNQENSCLVNFKLVPVGDNQYPHARQQDWADADTMHAAKLMRRLVDEPGYAARLGARAAIDVRHMLSPGAVARQLIDRIEGIQHGHVQA